MANLTSRLVISLVDRASAGARRITSSLGAMRAAEGAMASSTMTNVRRQARTMRAMRTIGGHGAGLTGLGATAGALGFLSSEMKYQEAMNRTQAVLNMTDDKAFKPHRDLVVDLAKRYPATSAEIAQGASEIAMAGMSMKQVNEVLEAAVQGSMASGESIKTVGMGVTDVLLGLGKAANKENFLELNNIMAAASTSYSQTYSQFLAGYAKSAPLARMINMDVRQLAGTLGILADAGFKAEKGGTALRSSIIYAATPTPKAQKFLEKYGIELAKFKKQTDKFQLGGEHGARTLSDMIATELGIEDAGLAGALTPLLSDENAFGDTTTLKKRLVSTIVGALGLQDGENTKLIAESVNQFVESGFQQLDFLGLLRKLEAVGFDHDITAMDALFKKRFTAPMGAVINSLADGAAFDQKMEVFLPRIHNAVERFAAILMKGLPGAVRRLGGAFDALLRTMASSGAIDDVVWAIDKLRSGINWLGEQAPWALRALAVGLVGLGVLAPIGLVLSGFVATMTLFGTVAMGAARGVMFFVRAVKALSGAGKAVSAAAPLFSLGAGAVGGAAALKASKGMIAGMSGAAGAAASRKMIAGMGAAGMAKAAGKGLLARLIPGVGQALLLAGLGTGAYAAYQDYQKTGDLWSAAKAGGVGFLTLGTTGAEAAEAPKAGAAGGGQPDGQAIASEMQTSMAQVRQIVASVDLTSEGQRIMQSLANGIRAGAGAVAAAAREAGAAQIQSAVNGAYSDAGR